MLEPDFFGQEARQEAEAWSKMSAAAEADGAGEDYGGVGKDLDKDSGVLAVQSGTLVPDGAADGPSGRYRRPLGTPNTPPLVRSGPGIGPVRVIL